MINNFSPPIPPSIRKDQFGHGLNIDSGGAYQVDAELVNRNGLELSDVNIYGAGYVDQRREIQIVSFYRED